MFFCFCLQLINFFFLIGLKKILINFFFLYFSKEQETNKKNKTTQKTKILWQVQQLQIFNNKLELLTRHPHQTRQYLPNPHHHPSPNRTICKRAPPACSNRATRAQPHSTHQPRHRALLQIIKTTTKISTAHQ